MRQTWTILYLNNGTRKRIAEGEIRIVGRDPVTGSVDIQYAGEQARKRNIKTVWHRDSHDSGIYGSSLLKSFVGKGVNFAFPKSLYAVRDTLGTVARDKPDALILDFFAGSGTSLHATCLLNLEDGGNRRCILVTNNEVDADSTKSLSQKGIFRGDREFEALGIFEQVTRPRCESALSGRLADASEVPGTYLNGHPFAEGFTENVEFFRIDYLDSDDVDLGKQFDAILPALWLAAGGIGQREAGVSDKGYSIPQGSTYGVLFRESRFRKFKTELLSRGEVGHVWIVTDSEEAFAEMCSALPRNLAVSMLYRDYLRNFRITEDSMAKDKFRPQRCVKGKCAP